MVQVGQWIVGVIRFQKINGLYGSKHHIVKKMLYVIISALTVIIINTLVIVVGVYVWHQHDQQMCSEPNVEKLKSSEHLTEIDS